MTDILTCPLCGAPHHTEFAPIVEAATARGRPALDDPVAQDAFAHILTEHLKVAGGELTEELTPSVIAIAESLGWLVAASERAGRVGVLRKMFDKGPGEYLVVIGGADQEHVATRRMDA